VGIWVVILEAVATADERSGLGVEPGALDDLAEELAKHYAVVSERPWAYETEMWVEEGTAGGAVLAAQFLWQAAVRYLGLPAWEVVRAEVRDAHALEVGIIDWPPPPAGIDPTGGDAADEADEPAPLELPTLETQAVSRPRAKAATRKKVATGNATTKHIPARKAVKNGVAKKAVAKKVVAKKAVAKKVVAKKAVTGTPRRTRA